eukprot:scaffold143171_cov23-Cyclotella_meneghiniana.AAC.1
MVGVSRGPLIAKLGVPIDVRALVCEPPLGGGQKNDRCDAFQHKALGMDVMRGEGTHVLPWSSQPTKKTPRTATLEPSPH